MMKSKHTFLLIPCIFFILYSCGIPEEEHNKILAENAQLKKQIEELQNRFDVSMIKSKLSLLSKQLSEYKSGIPADIISTLETIDLQKNTVKLESILETNVGTFISSSKLIHKEYDKFQKNVSVGYDSIIIIDSKIRKLKAEIEQLKSEGYVQKRFLIKRRFGTYGISNKGMYECFDYDNYRTAVLVASEDEAAGSSYFNEKVFTVKPLGEKATTVTTTTIYGSTDRVEYYKYFETVSSTKNPRVKTDEVKELLSYRKKMDAKLSAESKEYLKSLETVVINNKDILINLLNEKNI